MVSFLASLAINLALQIGLNVLSRLLEPKRRRPKPQPFEAPTASSGTPMGKGFGIFEVQPSITLVTQPALEQDEFGPDDIPITRYFVKLNLVCGWGPINVLYDIVSDELSIKTLRPVDPNLTLDPNLILPSLAHDFDATPGPVEFSINANHMYGGPGEEGGLQGLLKFYPGTTDQPVDPLTTEVDGDFSSAYPWCAYARLGAETGRAEGLSTAGLNEQGDRFYVSANSPTPRPISFILGAYPDLLLGDGGRMGLDGNAAEILYEIHTDRKWGARKPASRFDLPQWITKAQQIRNEGIGISIPRDDPRSLDDIAEDILTHIDGGIVEDPLTGLLQLKLARDDYNINDLPTINKSNTDNFTRGKPLPPRTLNDVQVRYRRYHGGVSGQVTSEFATRDLNWNTYLSFDLQAFGYKSAGDQIVFETAKVFVDDVEVPVKLFSDGYVDGDPVLLKPAEGLWLFIESDEIQEGVEVRIEYVAQPKFAGFVDDVATSQNLANQRSRGRQQPESYDYSFYTNPIAAQWKADRLRATMSRSLDTFRWEGKRDQSHLTPWDVVKLLEPAWGVTEPIAIRITKVSQGTRTNPKLTFEGVKDLWGEQLFLETGGIVPVIRPPQQAAPAMGIGCGVGGEGVSRIDLFPTDSFYAVEVWESSDEIGTGAVLVETIAAGTDPMFYDGTVGKFYAARQISDFNSPGPFTSWITCADVDEPPVDPTCVVPTYTYDADDQAGIVNLLITDPQGRVQLVEWRSRSGSEEWTAWEVATAPYCFSVTLLATEDSRIEWRITYLDCDGSIDILTDGYDFIAPQPETPTPGPFPGLISVPVPVLLYGATLPRRFDTVLAERTPLTTIGVESEEIPLAPFTICYLTAVVKETNLPEGSYIGAEFENPDVPDDWHPLSEDGGPIIAVDETTWADDLTKPLHGDDVTIRIEARERVRVRAVLFGGDGSPIKVLKLSRVTLWLWATETTSVEPPETDDPPLEDPTSCDVATPLDMDTGWTGGNVPGAVWSNLSNTTARVTLDGTGSGPSQWEKTFTGLTPNKLHTFYLSATTPYLPVGAFIEVEDGEHAEVTEINTVQTLKVQGDSDGSGNLTLRYGVEEIAGEPGGGGEGSGGDTLQHASGVEAAAAGWSNIGGTTTWNSGLAVGPHPSSVRITGGSPDGGISNTLNLVPGAGFVFGVWTTSGEGAWWVPTGITILASDGVTQLGGIAAVGTDVDTYRESAIVTVPEDGILIVEIEQIEFFGVRPTYFSGLAWEQVSGPPAEEVVVDFSDLGFCVGGGFGTPGTGAGPGGEDPIPEPPPGGWEPPVSGGTRPFMIHNIPAAGLAYWNGTVKTFTVSTTVNLIDTALTAGTHLLLKPGPEETWMRNGSFVYELWEERVNLLYNDLRIREAIIEGYTHPDRPIWAWWLFDEPFHKSRYGPGGIPFATVERAAGKIKTFFPNINVILRMDPTDERLVRAVSGVDMLWAEYHLARGPIESYRDTRIAGALAMNVKLIFGIHYFKFGGTSSTNYITPSQLTHYGGVLARPSPQYPTFRAVAFGGWQYANALWIQAGMPVAVRNLRDEFNSYDPAP